MSESKLWSLGDLSPSDALRVEQACSRFEKEWQAWRGGPRPDLRQALGEADGGPRAVLLVELLRLELAYRRQAGERPALAEYLPRFPGEEELLRHGFAGTMDPPDAASDPQAPTLLPASPVPGGASTLEHQPADALAEGGLIASNERPTANAAARLIPGYEILGELGRGGMGVVYKARHLELNRVVALKMILAGGHAGPDEITRFRTEAQALARLQHPNIVQVHEVGAHDGRPFFSLEFVEGGGLDRKLKGSPIPPRQAAQIVETLARAMQAAHESGVVHRDLKPANVLVGAKWVLKITDFGLAKKLDAPGQTQSGAVMGTPSYMAPEQAGGKTREIGPAADVYALGAILYELLTGRPPFKAATALDTILQVLADEPVPPRQLQSKTPRDLETVCLKCLQKEPSRRYASAAALADDLQRFVEGRPVVARPVGPLERAAKWVRRKPALAGGVGSVAAALLLGTAVSAWFAIDASHQADKARGNEATANINEAAARKSEADAIAARNNLKTANQDLARTADSLETTLSRSFLRPLALQGGDKPMTEPEWEALWDLATNRRGRLGYRFVEEASRTPVTSRQLRDRAALALPAAVGLDAERRAEVEALLLVRLDDPTLGEDQKTDLALAASAWDGLSSSGANGTARQLTRAMTAAREPFVLKELAQGLSAVSVRMETKDAATVTAQAATTLVQAMKDTKNLNALKELAQGLSAVSGRLEAKDAAQVATTLVQAMKDPSNFYSLPLLAYGLSAVSDRMEAKDAATVAAQASTAFAQAMMNDVKDPTALSWLVLGLSAVSAHMDPQDAAQAATTLVRAMKDAKDFNTLQRLAQGLSAVSAHMDAQDAAQAATTLVQAMKNIKEDNNALQGLAQGLSAVSARLDAQDAAQAATTLVQIMKDNYDQYAFPPLAQGLSAVSAHLEAKDAAQAATTLVQAMKNIKEDNNALQGLAQGLSAVSARLEAKDAAQAATALVQAMKDTKNLNSLSYLAQGLSAVSARMEAKDAATVTAQAATALVQAMKDIKDPYALSSLAQGLSALSAHLEAKDAEQALVQAMNNNYDPYAFPPLAQPLSDVSIRLEAQDAAQALTTLVQAMKEAQDFKALFWLAQGLSAVSARLDSKDAAQAATTLVQDMKNSKDPNALFWLAQGLSALSARLEAKDAAQAATTLVQDMKNSKDPNTLSWLAQGLSALSARMETKDAATVTAQAATTLVQAMKDTKDPNALSWLAQGLSAVSAHMDAKDAAGVAAQAATILLQAMKDAKNLNALHHLAQGLSAVSARMEAKDAATVTAQAATTLVQAMKDAKDPGALGYLVRDLSAVSARMEAKDAVTTLIRAMKDTKDFIALQDLARGLSPVSVRLQAKDAALAAASLLAMTKTSDPVALQFLAQTLSVVLSDNDPASQRTRGVHVSTAVASIAGAGQPLAALAPLIPAAEPLPCRLSTQQLVELLKMPTCVGPARRVVLDHLGNRYRHPFADAWEFVRFAEEQKLGLDLTSPPQRPDLAALPL